MEELLRCKTVQEAFRFLEKDDKEDVAGNSGNVPDSGTLLSGKKKAEYVFHKMQEAGLEDVHIDAVGNVLGVRKETEMVLVSCLQDTLIQFSRWKQT